MQIRPRASSTIERSTGSSALSLVATRVRARSRGSAGRGGTRGGRRVLKKQLKASFSLGTARAERTGYHPCFLFAPKPRRVATSKAVLLCAVRAKRPAVCYSIWTMGPGVKSRCIVRKAEDSRILPRWPTVLYLDCAPNPLQRNRSCPRCSAKSNSLSALPISLTKFWLTDIIS